VLPFDEAQAGWFLGWLKSALLLMTSPSRALRRVASDADVGASLRFSFVSSLFGYLPSLIIFSVILRKIVSDAGSSIEDVERWFFHLALWFLLATGCAVEVLLRLLAAVIETGVFGLRSGASFSVTLRAGALSLAPRVLGLLPFVGLLVFPVWSLLLRIKALARFHRVSRLKAGAAVVFGALAEGVVFVGLSAFAMLMACILVLLPD
jgi:hypothetical protein